MTQLCQHRDELKSLNTEVLLVSFTTDREYAQDWLKYTCDAFSLLFDPDREVYRTYGMERSWLRSWNMRTIWRYVQLMRSGRRWRGIQGDSAQLGGDFIIDANQVLRLVHRSHDPTDRPPVERLLARLQELSKERADSAPASASPQSSEGGAAQ